MADLKELFKEAAEIAQQVPENMQEAAFNRALDLLTNKSDEKPPARRARGAKRSQNRKANEQPIEEGSANPTSKNPRKSSSGLGPKSAIAWLMESGFFSVGKTRTEVQEYLREKRGYNIGTDQLGVAMLRLVREGVLERAENEDGQYEFKQPDPE